jgi:arylformamidase
MFMNVSRFRLRLLAAAVRVLAVSICVSWTVTVRAQDASKYYTVQHPEQFKTDWAAFYREIDARTAAVRAEFPHHLDLPFGPNVKQRLDLYLPRGKVTAAPVFLFLHGGGFREGDRAQYGYVAKPFAERGIIAAVASYRLTGEGFVYPSQIEDVKLAVSWLYHRIKRYGGDRMRIYVGGHSSGAILAADVGIDRSWLKQAGVPARALRGIAPVSALYDLRLTDPTASKKVFWSVYAPTAEQERASPILHVRDPVANAVVAVGSNEQQEFEDFVAGSRAFVEKLNATGAHAELIVLEGKSHADTALALSDEHNMETSAIIRMITGSASNAQ